MLRLFSLNEAAPLFRLTYSRGITIFLYGSLWIPLMLAGYIGFDSLFASSSGLFVILLIATLTSALAGGMGGATAMLSRLYKHVAIKQNFHEQSLRAYILQPLTGILVGVLILYVITIPLTLIVNLISIYLLRGGEFLYQEILTGSTFISVQIILSWSAGFYQGSGLDKLKTLTGYQLTTIQNPDNIDLDQPLAFKVWHNYRENMVRWSYTWGLLLLVYGVIWAIFYIATYLQTVDIFLTLETGSVTPVTALIFAAWPSAAAGGLGGVFSVFKHLYHHVSLDQDFHPQHSMSYLVQPIIGFVMGFIMYFLLASGYLALHNSAGNLMLVDSGTVVMLQFLLAWIAGFRQQTVTDLIQKLIEQIVALVKYLLTFILNPKIWFNKTERDKWTKKVPEQAGVFASMAPDDSVSQK